MTKQSNHYRMNRRRFESVLPDVNTNKSENKAKNNEDITDGKSERVSQ